MDGGGYFVRFGGGEDEEDMRGWFFERFEERVEGFGGEHMHFVDDVYFVPTVYGEESYGVSEGAYFVDAAVGGCVDLEDVHGCAFGYFTAGDAGAAGVCGGAVVAVERAGEYLGCAGLACTARA